MPRLIDATRIEQYILNNCSDNEEINAIYAEIVNAPTVDAEPVVRCKDCIYSGQCFREIIMRQRMGNLYCPLGDNGYCSMGRRKEDG